MQSGGNNSTNIQAGGDIHFVDVRTVSQRARARIESMRGPNVIESFGKAFSASLPLTSPPPAPSAPRPQRHTLADWWTRVRTDLAVLPLYNVNWIELAERAFDLDALDDESPWELVQEYGKKIALLRETFDAGDLYPPRA